MGNPGCSQCNGAGWRWGVAPAWMRLGPVWIQTLCASCKGTGMNSSRAGCASGADGSAAGQTGTPQTQRTGEVQSSGGQRSVFGSTTYSPGPSSETEE